MAYPTIPSTVPHGRVRINGGRQVGEGGGGVRVSLFLKIGDPVSIFMISNWLSKEDVPCSVTYAFFSLAHLNNLGVRRVCTVEPIRPIL